MSADWSDVSADWCAPLDLPVTGTQRLGVPIGASERKGRKSAVTWLGAEREAELSRRDVERLRERGWL